MGQINKFSRIALCSAIIISAFLQTADASATTTPAPSVYGVMQQQGPTCPFIPFANLRDIRAARGDDGALNLEALVFRTKAHSYAEFLPQIRAYDRALDSVRHADGEYAVYEDQVRAEGVYNAHRYTTSGYHVSKQYNKYYGALKNLRAEAYAPFNFQIKDEHHDSRRLPITVSGIKAYFYDYTAKTVSRLPNSFEAGVDQNTLVEFSPRFSFSITDEQMALMNITRQEAQDYNMCLGINKAGDEDMFVLMANSKTERYRRENTYSVGTYHQMLFAMGVDRDMGNIDANHPLHAAHTEFKAEMDREAINPWANIDRNDLFEYHLACVFRDNAVLKERAKQAVNYYNDAWTYYQASFDLVDDTGTSMAAKQVHLPGEDLMLAYLFSNELRFTMAASIGIDAVIETMEVQEEIGEKLTWLVKKAFSTKGVMSAARADKYEDADGTFSFMSVWQQAKAELLESANGQRDFVTFSGHGCVVSFDEELVAAQHHEHPDAAEELGFVHWEQLYDKGLRPFYKRPGTDADRIDLPE